MIAKLTLAVLLSLAVAAPGCRPTAEIEWPKVVSCGQRGAMSLFESMMAIVAKDGFSAVFSGASIEAIEDLAVSYGPSAVACVLAEVLDKVAPRGAADPTLPEIESRRASRILHFLQQRNIEVTNAGH